MATLVGGGLLGSALYFSSPHIPYAHYETKKELKNTLNNSKDTVFIHEDPTTTQILDFMSGMIDKETLQKLLTQHGYNKEDIEAVKMREADPALYHALWEMHMHYANPKMTFKGNYSHYGCLIKNAIMGQEDSLQEETVYPASYNFNTNTIKLYNLDSLPFSFNHNFHHQELRLILDTERFLLAYTDPLSPQRILLNNWIAELSHAQQNLQYGPIKPQIDAVVDFVTHGLDYSVCYDNEGTVEYEAHKQLEIRLTEEFIKLYESYIDPEDPKAAWNLAKFYGGYFKNYDNKEGYKKRLKICATKFEDPEAAIWLWNIALSKFRQLSCDGAREMGCNTSQEAEMFLDEAMERYTIAIENGSEVAVIKLVSLSQSTPEGLKKGIQWFKYLVKTSDAKRDNPILEAKKRIAFQELLVLETSKLSSRE